MSTTDLLDSDSAAIECRGLTIRYDVGAPAVRALDLHVRPGEVVALLGANGAGKSSTLHALAGVIRQSEGSVHLAGGATNEPLHQRARRGVGFLSEERSIFSTLTVSENLRVGRGEPDVALDLFPELRTHLDKRAGLLSGGQQQMLSLGRVLASRPQVLLADELSLGLAPIVVRRLLDAVRAAADEGLAVLLVEQHVNLALQIADRAYVLRRGELAFSGEASLLLADADLLASMYLTEQTDD